jgi:PST family polysaccharide transporter
MADLSTRRGRTSGLSGSYGKKAKVGALWKFGSESIQQLIEIPTVVLLARLLTPEDYGIAAAAGFFLRLANKIGSFGIGGGALMRLKEVRPEHFSSIFVLNLISGFFIWFVLTVTAPALARFFRHDEIAPALRVAAVVYLVLPFGVGQFAMINRELRFKQIAILGWIYPLTFLVVSVPLALAKFGFWSLIYGQLAASLAAVVGKVYCGRQPHRLKVSRQALRETFPFGAGLSTKRLLNFAAEYLDSLIVGRLFGVTSLGYYDKAFNTMNRIVDRVAFGPAVFFRIFAIIQDEPQRLRRAYEKVMVTISLMVFPAFAGLIVVAPQLIEVAYGPQWGPTVVPFQILCVAGAMRLSVAYASAATQAAGLIWSEVWRQVAYVAMVVGGVLLCRAWGIVGAAVGVTSAAFCMAILMQILASRLTHLGWRGLLLAQVPGAVAAAGLVVVLLLTEAAVRASVGQPHAWHLLLPQMLSGALFLGLFTLYCPFERARDVIEEAVTDFAPGLLKYFRRAASAAAPADVTVDRSAALPPSGSSRAEVDPKGHARL